MRRPLAVVAQRLSFSSRAGTTHRPWLRTPLARVVLSCALTVCVVVTCALGATLVLAFHGKPASHAVIVTQAVAPSFTAPGFTHAAFARQQIAVDPLFQAYYTNAAGSTQLGAALTPAMPISGGWLQFFTSGALFLPSQSPAISGHWVAQAGDAAPLDESLRLAIQQVLREDPDEVAPLPLLSALMNAGSEEPIDGTASLSYADLRQAIKTSSLVPAPSWYAPNRPVGPAAVFVPEALRAGVVLGHLVPLSFWTMMTEPSSAPDGWTVDFGMPLTEALPATIEVAGTTHRLLVQVYQYTALVVDTTAAPQMARPLAVGADYLTTFGPPSILVAGTTPGWVSGDTIIHQTPHAGSPALAHLGPGYPLVLASGSRWVNGALWYQVTWQGLRARSSGWIPASAVSFVAPPAGPAYAGIDVLDPNLATYLAGLGDQAGVVVSDLTHNVYYASNSSSEFITGSSVKVPIMLALLAQTEAQAREPDGNEMYLLTTMIENSDNGSAQALYEEIGDAPGLTAFMGQIGVGGLAACPGAWGWSQISPAAMVQVLTLLKAGRILTAQDRALALNLMENVEGDQQFGVGDTAPAGATVALKNGWVVGPDNLWVVNSSGIVVTSNDTYLIAVYTRDDGSYQQGVDVVEQISAAVSNDLN